MMGRLLDALWPMCSFCGRRVHRPLQRCARWPEGDAFHHTCEGAVYDKEDAAFDVL